MITFELLSPGKYVPTGYWTELAPGTSRLEVEIGPGDGRFLVESAQQDAATLFVGLEVREGLARHIIERPDLPRNARPYHLDGRFIVCHLLDDASVDAFHIYFPDPWWKKRHHKRRLFTDEFVAALQRCLKPDGRVFVITDVEPLFVDICAKLEHVNLRRRDWYRSDTDPAQSSYERKYRRQGRRLLETSFVKVSGSPAD